MFIVLIGVYRKVGFWHDHFGIRFSRNFSESYSDIVESLQNKTLVVTTIMVFRDIIFYENGSDD